MTLTEALNRAAAIHNTHQGRRTVVGIYPNGSTVRVARDEEADYRLIGLGFSVTIRSPLVGEDTRIVTGPDGIRSHLRARRLSDGEADWTIAKGHTP